MDQITGRYGETLTARELKMVQSGGRTGNILRNLYIPKENGETSEIDVVYLSVKGIFVIESKNHSGWIFGDDKEKYWTVCLPDGEHHRFYNPVYQNRTHIRWLDKYLEDMSYSDIPMFP